jgi:CRISPR-associated protein Cmr5
MPTLDQERARFAWQRTENVTADFKNLVSGAPSLIMTNGLMQALAYYKEKGHGRDNDRDRTRARRAVDRAPERSEDNDNDHDKLRKALVDWLCDRLAPDERNLSNGDEKFALLMRRLHESDADTYFRATEEALAILRWIRQYAKARAAMRAAREK